MHFNFNITDFNKNYPIEDYMNFYQTLKETDPNLEESFLGWFSDNYDTVVKAFVVRLQMVTREKPDKIISMSLRDYALDCYVTVQYHQSISNGIDDFLENL